MNTDRHKNTRITPPMSWFTKRPRQNNDQVDDESRMERGRPAIPGIMAASLICLAGAWLLLH